MHTQGTFCWSLQVPSAELEDLSNVLATVCSWKNALGAMLRAIANRPFIDDCAKMR